MHKRLEHMKETLMCCVEAQLMNLTEVDTQELGDVVDMIKDIEEAIYYCTVTEAMKGNGSEFEVEMKKGDHHREDDSRRMYYSYPMMYADDGRRRRSDGTFYADSSHMDGRNYSDSGTMYRDEREGRSYNSRRMYMEAKDMRRDKATQLRELEKYMQELSQDITEMIADASPEEKQYLEKKITALASKIGQMK